MSRREEEILEDLRNYKGHWRRKNHRPWEIRFIAATEGSIWRAERLELLERLIELERSGRGRDNSALLFNAGSIGGLARETGICERRLQRILAAYRAAGLRGVFSGWLKKLRKGYQLRIRQGRRRPRKAERLAALASRPPKRSPVSIMAPITRAIQEPDPLPIEQLRARVEARRAKARAKQEATRTAEGRRQEKAKEQRRHMRACMEQQRVERRARREAWRRARQGAA